MKAPTVHGIRTLALAANVPSVATLTNGGEGSDQSLTVICNNNFDIVFSHDRTPNIPDASLLALPPFNLRTPYTFHLGRPNSHFKVQSPTASIFTYWLGPDARKLQGSNIVIMPNPVYAPTVRNTVLAAIPSGTSTTPITIGESSDRSINLIHNNGQFDMLFSDDGTDLTFPALTQPFMLGGRKLYTFGLSPKNKYFRMNSGAAGTLKYWLTP